MEEKQPCEDDLPTRLWPSAYLVSDDDESDLSDLSDIDIPSDDDDDNPFLGPHQSLTPRQISFPDQPSSGSSQPDFSSPILERNAQDRKAHRLAKGHKKHARVAVAKSKRRYYQMAKSYSMLKQQPEHFASCQSL